MKMKNVILKNLIILVAMSFAISSIGQEKYFDSRYLYSQAFLNPILLNPAAAGIKSTRSAFLNYRNTWSGFNNAPRTVTFGYDGKLIDRVGFGAVLMQDNFGALRTNKVSLNFSYGIESPKNVVRFGLATDYLQHGLNNLDASDNQLDPNDPLVRERRTGSQFFDLTAGIFGVYDKKITYGIAIPSMVTSRINNTDQPLETEIGFIFNVGYRLDEIMSDVSLEPSVFVKKLNNVPTHFDFNLKAGFLDDKLSGGVSYTLGADNRLGFLLGFNLNKLDIFYTYNTSTYEFQTYNNGSHEFTFRYNIDGGSTAK
jgi:type IX secretion system PorP/SprF family membrane protein